MLPDAKSVDDRKINELGILARLPTRVKWTSSLSIQGLAPAAPVPQLGRPIVVLKLFRWYYLGMSLRALCT